MSSKIAIYTSIFGGYDSLIEHEIKLLSYIVNKCFASQIVK